VKRDFTIGAAWSTASAWAEQAVSALNFLVIARLIGVESFGIAAMAFAFLFLGEFLVRDTLTEAIVERRVLEEGRLDATFFALIGFSLFVILALAVISQLAARAYGQPAVAPLLLAASPTVLMIGAAGVSTALLRRQMAYRTLAIRSLLGVIGGGIVGITMALNDFGAWSLVNQRLTEIGINSVTAFTAARWIPKRWPSRRDFALLKGLGPKVVILRSMSLVIVQTPTVALGVFADPRAAGLFAFASRVVEIVVSLIVQPLQGVAQSAIAAMRRRHAATDHFFLDLINLAAWVAFPAFVGLAAVAGPLVEVLLGREWSAAAPALSLLCIFGSLTALNAVQEAYLLAIDRVDAFVRATAFEALIGIGIVAAASRYGLAAAAGGIAIRGLVALPLRTSAALAPEKITPGSLISSLMSPTLAALGMAVPVVLWRVAMLGRVPDLVFLISTVVVGVTTVCIFLFGLMPNSRARLQTFFQPSAERQP
jgi:O-antigen/teichoic acid export membrane protein